MIKNFLRIGIVIASLSPIAFGQAGGKAPSTPAPPTTGRPTTTAPSTPTTQPSTQSPTTNPSLQRPIYLTGKVLLNDGQPPPESVPIQLVCGGGPRTVGFTDSKGRFSIDLGNRNNSSFSDASEPGFNSRSGGSTAGFGTTAGNSSTLTERSFSNCDLQASLPGFRSDQITLANRQALDNPEVGTVILHRVANVEGLTISLTSAMAPKDAKKAFDKGRNEAKKEKWENAQREFAKAVEIYPKYATAWYELGVAQQKLGDVDAARKSYAQALAADPKYVNPHQQLAAIAVKEQNWQDVAASTHNLLRLNPVDFPQAWYFNALANYRLKNIDEAEKAARGGLASDKSHQLPKMAQLLGAILVDKRDFVGAAENLRDYLKYSPDATDAPQVKKFLAEFEKATAEPQAVVTKTPDK